MSGHDVRGLRLVWSAPAVTQSYEGVPEAAATIALMCAIIRKRRREEALAAGLDAYRRTGAVGACSPTDRP